MSRLNFALQAQVDLQQIYDYIAEDNPLAALRVIDSIQIRAKSLADNPGMGRKRNEIVANMRSVAEGNYVIFYLSVSDGIEVARVLHAKRDVKRIFEKPN